MQSCSVWFLLPGRGAQGRDASSQGAGGLGPQCATLELEACCRSQWGPGCWELGVTAAFAQELLAAHRRDATSCGLKVRRPSVTLEPQDWGASACLVRPPPGPAVPRVASLGAGAGLSADQGCLS